jgi:lantibiotic biosynthesis protein
VTGEHPALRLAEAIADRLAHPDTAGGLPSAKPWWPQSLAHGVPGIALLHTELAAAGRRPWQRAHDWLTCATRTPFTTGPGSHPFYGAPALAHVLACAAGQRPGCCARALDKLDREIAAEARRRVAAAHARIDQGRLAALAEFDALQGLSGLGSYLLRRDPCGTAVRAVLEYLVRLTDPVQAGGEILPGWWTASGPSGRDDERFPGGHANSGQAHGVSGPLTLLATAALRGVTVDGHAEAIRVICAWLDRWRADTDQGTAWPYWVTRPELRAGHLVPSRPVRPSWCYGTAGLARAQQVAALASGDTGRQRMAEDALARALTDPAQLAATTGASLCHGYAGLAHIAAIAAADAGPGTASRLHALIPGLLDAVQPPGTDPGHTAAALLGEAGCGPGFLEGATGVALACLAPATTTLPRSGWDACLLIA